MGWKSTRCREVPSNAVLAESSCVFEMVSPSGRTVLTQLTTLAWIAIRVRSRTLRRTIGRALAIARAIAAARQLGKPIGICGQAPSDYPEFWRRGWSASTSTRSP